MFGHLSCEDEGEAFFAASGLNMAVKVGDRVRYLEDCLPNVSNLAWSHKAFSHHESWVNEGGKTRSQFLVCQDHTMIEGQACAYNVKKISWGRSGKRQVRGQSGTSCEWALGRMITDEKQGMSGESPTSPPKCDLLRCSEGNKIPQRNVVDVCACDCFEQDGEERPGSRITTNDHHDRTWLTWNIMVEVLCRRC